MKLNPVGRVARNYAALIAALLVQRAASVGLYVLIARYLGVLEFGQFSLVYNFFIIFEIPTTFGLVSLIVREVAKDKSKFSLYLINGHVMVLISSLGSIAIWVISVHLLGYSQQVITSSYLLCIALIPFAMSKICEATFQAFERMQFITYAITLVSLAKIALVWLLLSRGFGLLPVVGLITIMWVSLLLLEWVFIYRRLSKPEWIFDWGFCRKAARVAITFLGIGVFTALFLRLIPIILSKLRGEVEVGLFNAAFQLGWFFMLISLSLMQAIFPVLSRTYQTNVIRFKQYTERSSEFLISLTLPLGVCFLFLADSILLVYREEFVAAAPVLKVIGWMLVPLSINRILGGVLLASGRQRANLNITIVNTICLLALSFPLIHRFGLFGAGVAALSSHMISFALHYAVVSKRVFTISIIRVTWKPLVSSLVLAVFLAVTAKGHSLWLILPAATMVYLIVLLALNFRYGGLIFREGYGKGHQQSIPQVWSDESLT